MVPLISFLPKYVDQPKMTEQKNSEANSLTHIWSAQYVASSGEMNNLTYGLIGINFPDVRTHAEEF